MSKLIPLSQGKYAVVDDEDYDFLMELPNSSRNSKWRRTNFGYARLNINDTYLLMHRLVMNAPPYKDVDHINRNKLDNRKSNLRVCSAQDNRRNSGLSRLNTSGTKGVHYVVSRNKWQARIGINYKRISLGYYDSLDEAVKVREQAVLQHFKDFAPSNIGVLR